MKNGAKNMASGSTKRNSATLRKKIKIYTIAEVALVVALLGLSFFLFKIIVG